MINLHESDVAELGFELTTPKSAVRHATECDMKHCHRAYINLNWRDDFAVAPVFLYINHVADCFMFSYESDFPAGTWHLYNVASTSM